MLIGLRGDPSVQSLFEADYLLESVRKKIWHTQGRAGIEGTCLFEDVKG